MHAGHRGVQWREWEGESTSREGNGSITRNIMADGSGLYIYFHSAVPASRKRGLTLELSVSEVLKEGARETTGMSLGRKRKGKSRADGSTVKFALK